MTGQEQSSRAGREKVEREGERVDVGLRKGADELMAQEVETAFQVGKGRLSKGEG